MKIKDIMKLAYLMGTIVACAIVVSCGNEELNEIGQGSVTFNISTDHLINESRATVEVPTPETMILAMLRDANQVYKSIEVPLSNGVASPFTQIVSSNTYTFVATNYESRDIVYAKNDGRGDCWFYASEEKTVNTGDVFDVNLTAKVCNFKVTIEYSDGFNVLENCVATMRRCTVGRCVSACRAHFLFLGGKKKILFTRKIKQERIFLMKKIIALLLAVLLCFLLCACGGTSSTEKENVSGTYKNITFSPNSSKNTFICL